MGRRKERTGDGAFFLAFGEVLRVELARWETNARKNVKQKDRTPEGRSTSSAAGKTAKRNRFVTSNDSNFFPSFIFIHFLPSLISFSVVY